MKTAEYLEALLTKYASTFDIHRDYPVDDRVYPAYGYFKNTDEKFVLSRNANLWTALTYEHVLFLETDRCTAETVEQIRRDMIGHMEPQMVREGRKFPEKDHMHSFMTVVILSEHEPGADVIRAVKRFRFRKSYLFDFRGHSEGHLVCVSMESGNVWANGGGKYLIPMLRDNFS